MRHIPRVFVEAALSEGAAIPLSGETAHHLLNVLRVQAGEPLVLFDGRGGEYAALVAATGKRELSVRVGERRLLHREPPLKLTLAQAVSRGERMDYAIQKAVELGVSAVQPLQTEHSLQLDGARADRKLAHWRAIAKGAAEQSGRERVPAVEPLLPLAAWLTGPGSAAIPTKLALHPGGVALKSLAPANELSLVVGPEGGLSEKDLQLCSAAGFQTVSLGPRILRTETAAVAALAAMQALWGDLA